MLWDDVEGESLGRVKVLGGDDLQPAAAAGATELRCVVLFY
jgi:hypothetical protein